MTQHQIETQFYHDAIAGFLSTDGPYFLSLHRDEDGVPLLSLSHGDHHVDLDMLDVYEQCAHLIKQHEKMHILELHRAQGLDCVALDWADIQQ